MTTACTHHGRGGVSAGPHAGGLSNALQNAMIGPDNSLPGGCIGAATILGLKYGLARLVSANRKMERWLEGTPTLLIHNGRVLEQNLRRELLTRDELMAALRRQGILAVEEVRVALLEATGAITVVRKGNGDAARAGTEHSGPAPSP